MGPSALSVCLPACFPVRKYFCTNALPEAQGEEICGFFGCKHSSQTFSRENRHKFCHRNFTTFFPQEFTRSQEICHLVLTLVAISCKILRENVTRFLSNFRIYGTPPSPGLYNDTNPAALWRPPKATGLLEDPSLQPQLFPPHPPSLFLHPLTLLAMLREGRPGLAYSNIFV